HPRSFDERYSRYRRQHFFDMSVFLSINTLNLRSIMLPSFRAFHEGEQHAGPAGAFEQTLLLDSGVLADQQLNERTKQRFASLSDVVNKLEETQVEREFLLGNAPMRAKPTAQQRPEPFHCIHMYFTKAVAIFISSELASSM